MLRNTILRAIYTRENAQASRLCSTISIQEYPPAHEQQTSAIVPYAVHSYPAPPTIPSVAPRHQPSSVPLTYNHTHQKQTRPKKETKVHTFFPILTPRSSPNSYPNLNNAYINDKSKQYSGRSLSSSIVASESPQRVGAPRTVDGKGNLWLDHACSPSHTTRARLWMSEMGKTSSSVGSATSRDPEVDVAGSGGASSGASLS
jgi:hypothetical protein